MTTFAKAAGLVALTATVSVAAITTAQAGAFGINEYNAISTGEAYAGAPAGGAGVGSMAFNPATITDLSGSWASQTFTFIDPTVVINSPFGATNNIGNGGRVVPAGQGTYQFNDKLWFGFTIDSPFGLATEINPNTLASFYGHTTQVTNINFTPIVGYKVNDWLSVGAGPQVSWNYARLSTFLSPLVPGSYVDLNGHDIDVGYKLGATLKPFAGTEIGVGYRSQIRPELSGTFTNTIPLQGLSGNIIPVGSEPMKVNVVLPQQVNVGLRQVVTDNFTLLGTYQWTDWSAFKRFIVNTDFGPATQLIFDYKNGWLIGAGGEYKYNEKTTLRAGVNFEKSPIDYSNRAPSLPDDDRIMVAGGASYQFTKEISADVAYAHVFEKNGAINLTSPANSRFSGVPFIGNTNTNVNIVSLTLNYHLDTPPTVITAKY